MQRFQSFLRLLVAAGPLLGLVGTVIGMIITFHAIASSGSSDPKLMAHGIGQAMIATVLGLGIAILPDHGVTPDDLLRAADKALYRAKQMGRDQAQLAIPEAALTT